MARRAPDDVLDGVRRYFRRMYAVAVEREVAALTWRQVARFKVTPPRTEGVAAHLVDEVLEAAMRNVSVDANHRIRLLLDGHGEYPPLESVFVVEKEGVR